MLFLIYFTGWSSIIFLFAAAIKKSSASVGQKQANQKICLYFGINSILRCLLMLSRTFFISNSLLHNLSS